MAQKEALKRMNDSIIAYENNERKKLRIREYVRGWIVGLFLGYGIGFGLGTHHWKPIAEESQREVKMLRECNRFPPIENRPTSARFARFICHGDGPCVTCEP